MKLTTKPISKGFFLERSGRKPTWNSLKYEKISNICFKCRVLTRETRACKVEHETSATQFGTWLKAEDRSDQFVPSWPESEVGEKLCSSTCFPYKVHRSPMVVDLAVQPSQSSIDPRSLLDFWDNELMVTKKRFFRRERKMRMGSKHLLFLVHAGRVGPGTKLGQRILPS